MTATGYTGGDPSKVNKAGYVKGDLLAADVTGTLLPVAVGADTLVLTADSVAAEGVDYQAGGGGGGGASPSNTVVAQTTYGAASTAGVAVLYSRGDHAHGTVPLVTPASDGGFRGVWSAVTTYVAGDTVTLIENLLAGASYGAVTGNTNHQPMTLTPFLTASPAADGGDGNPYEMGFKFTVSRSIRLRRIEFYKFAGNGGTHVANLWNADTAAVQATGTFSGETATGLQSVDVVTTLVPGVNYICSVVMPQGHYGPTALFFAAPVTRGSVTAPATGGGFKVGSGEPDTFGTTSYGVSMVWEELDGAWLMMGRF